VALTCGSACMVRGCLRGGRYDNACYHWLSKPEYTAG